MKATQILQAVAISMALTSLGACGNHDSVAAAPSPQVSTQATAPAASPSPAVSVDRTQYQTVVTERTTTFGEADWKKFEQTAAGIVLHADVTKPEVLAALKFPAYARLTNPFDKDAFMKSHQADVTTVDPTPQKIRLVVKGSSDALLLAGDPLHGAYKGWLTMAPGSSFGYTFSPDSVVYVLKYAVTDLNFAATVSQPQAQRIEASLKRDSDGVDRSVPVIIYGSVVDTRVTYYAGGGRRIEVDVKPDAVDLADKLGEDAQPILAVTGPVYRNQ